MHSDDILKKKIIKKQNFQTSAMRAIFESNRVQENLANFPTIRYLY